MRLIEHLSRAEIASIHEYQLAQFGGSAGVRDEGLLASAIAMPGSSFGGQPVYATVPEVSAAYLFYLCKNHPFVDGNKRVAAAAALGCLRTNGYDWEVPAAEYAELVLKLAAGEKTKEDVIEFFVRHAVRRD